MKAISKCKEKLFLSNEEEQATFLYNSIQGNGELQTLEIQGFVRGAIRKKTLDVDINVIFESVGKQYRDFVRAYGDNNSEAMKRCLADLRNVAGCFFIKLTEEESRIVKGAT
jgi:hypothetical protein